MKPPLPLHITAIACVACSENNADPEPTQDYTSFVITQNIPNITLVNVVSGYRDGNVFRKIASHGDLQAGETTKEDTLKVNVDSIYIWTDNNSGGRFTKPFYTKEKRKNSFEINNTTSSMPCRYYERDSTNYPN